MLYRVPTHRITGFPIYPPTHKLNYLRSTGSFDSLSDDTVRQGTLRVNAAAKKKYIYIYCYFTRYISQHYFTRLRCSCTGLKTHSDWPTYPQLYVNGELVGGLDIVKEMKQEGSLREQLGIGDDIMVAKPAETLEQRLAKLVRRHKVMLFMKGLPSAPKCGFSRQMVEILDSKNISYEYVGWCLFADGFVCS